MNDIDKNLEEYINKNIFPIYENYYSHGMIHINNVISNMLMLAEYYKLNKNMAYVIAVYHDIGLDTDRDNHEYASAKIFANDKEMKNYFNTEQINTIKEAIEDHRGSRKERPRNFYGECISDSDRDFDTYILAKRQLATSIKNYPELNGFDEHFERCYKYICNRINTKGKFNLWTNNPILVEKRDEYQKNYLNKEKTRKIYQKEWNRITKDGTYEKIINFYKDY